MDTLENLDVDLLSEILIDVSAIGRKSTRKEFEASIAKLSGARAIKEDFWSGFLDYPRRVPKHVIVVADLACIARSYLHVNEHNWTAGIRQSLPVLVALLRTKRDTAYAGLVDDILKHSDSRLWVCRNMKSASILKCLSDAIVGSDARSIIAVRCQSSRNELWVEFGDGLSGFLSVDRLGLRGHLKELILESALVGQGGYSVQMLKQNGDLFDIDSDVIRAMLDAKYAKHLSDQESRSLDRLGDLLRDARKQAKLTQSELGDRIAIDQAIISKLERGKHRPRIDTLRRIATGLHTDVLSLLSGK